MRVDVPGLPEPRVRRLMRATCIDPTALPAPRRAEQPRLDGDRARRSRRRPATCSRCRASGRACSACASAPTREPDYGLVIGARASLHGRAAGAGHLDVHERRRDARARRRAVALPPAVEGATGRELDHRRAFSRLSTRLAGVRPRARRRPVDRRRSRSRPASRSTGSARSSARSTSAGSSSIRRSSTRSASTPARRTRTRRSRGARARATARGACSSTRPATRDARCRPSRLVAPLSYAVVVDDEALDLFVFARRRAGGNHRSLHAAHRPRAAGAALEPRPVGIARVLQDARGSRATVAAKLRAAQDSVRRADARRPRRVERRDALRLRVGSRRASPIPRAALAAIKAHKLRVCVWEYPYVSVHDAAVPASSRSAQLPADDVGRRSVRVRLGHGSRRRARSATC